MFWHKVGNGTSCELCAAGQFQDQFGMSECKLCPQDTYRPQTFDESTGLPVPPTSKKDCLSCPASPNANVIDRTTGEGSEGHSSLDSCKCKTGVHPNGYYSKRLSVPLDANATNTAAASGSIFVDMCAPCPKNADCSAEIGVPIARVVAQPGFWKAFENSTEFASCAIALTGGVGSAEAQKNAAERCCPGTHCHIWAHNATKNVKIVNTPINATTRRLDAANTTENWNPDVQCKHPYRGMLCTQCRKDHVKKGEECINCQGGDSKPMAWGLMAVSCVLFTLLQTVFVFYRGRKAETLVSKATDVTKMTARAGSLDTARSVKSEAIFGQIKMLMMCKLRQSCCCCSV
jgi:hypothetical protein